MNLPSKKVKATGVNPETMVIFSQPKMGKTSAVANLENCLIIDIEKGSNFVDALKINVIAEAKEQKKLPIVILKKLINTIAKENKKRGEYVYRYIALDTVSSLEDIVIPLANSMYQNTPMGRNWEGDSVLTLPQGAGYYYIREALNNIINSLSSICETLIILGHVKDKLIEVEGKEMNERGLALAGKSPAIICSQVDAVGYFYRDENEGRINFKPSESLLSGTRVKHLRNQDILLSEFDEEKQEVVTHWDKIFKN